MILPLFAGLAALIILLAALIILMVEVEAGFGLAVADGAGKEDVASGPEHYVAEEKQCGIDVG